MKSIESFLKQSPLYPALILESYFSEKKRRYLANITKYIVFSLPIIIILVAIFVNTQDSRIADEIDFLVRKLIGFGLVSLSIFLIMQIFEMYFASI